MRLTAHLPRVGAALVLATLALVTSTPSPASAQATTVTTSETLPFAGTATNPCNGDAVTFSGQIHVTNHVTTDSSGGTHTRTHVNYQGVSGTGAPSGALYNVRTTQNETRNDNVGPQAETTIIQVANLIAQGSVPNSKMHVVLHITINANGVTTSEVEEISVTCRG